MPKKIPNNVDGTQTTLAFIPSLSLCLDETGETGNKANTALLAFCILIWDNLTAQVPC